MNDQDIRSGIDIRSLQGWLYKRKSSSKLLTFLPNENARWFKICKYTSDTSSELALCYFESHRSKEVRGWMYINEILKISDDGSSSFTVTSPSRTLILKTESLGELKMWLRGLIALCPHADIQDIQTKITYNEDREYLYSKESHPTNSMSDINDKTSIGSTLEIQDVTDQDYSIQGSKDTPYDYHEYSTGVSTSAIHVSTSSSRSSSRENSGNHKCRRQHSASPTRYRSSSTEEDNHRIDKFDAESSMNKDYKKAKSCQETSRNRHLHTSTSGSKSNYTKTNTSSNNISMSSSVNRSQPVNHTTTYTRQHMSLAQRLSQYISQPSTDITQHGIAGVSSVDTSSSVNRMTMGHDMSDTSGVRSRDVHSPLQHNEYDTALDEVDVINRNDDDDHDVYIHRDDHLIDEDNPHNLISDDKYLHESQDSLEDSIEDDTTTTTTVHIRKITRHHPLPVMPAPTSYKTIKKVSSSDFMHK